MTEKIRFWLMKSEPDVYGIEDLRKEGITIWDGIRNYQARNFMRSMKIGDLAFFYHSNCKTPGIVGLMEVLKIGVIDPTQFDSKSKYFDQKSKRNNPRWDCIEAKYKGRFKHPLSLTKMKESFDGEELLVVKKGNRLSITPVSNSTAEALIKMLGGLY